MARRDPAVSAAMVYEALRNGIYWGPGDGAESGPFVGRLEVVTEGTSRRIRYEAWSDREGLQHQEHGLLTRVGDSLVLETRISESPESVLRFEMGDGRQFRLLDGPDMRIVFDVTDGGNAMSYAWWWAPAGDTVREQSRLDAVWVGGSTPGPVD